MRRKKNSSKKGCNSGDPFDVISGWRKAVQALHRLGGFVTQLEVLRLKIHSKHFEHLKGFEDDDWWGWYWRSAGCCCLAPTKVAEEIFQGEATKREPDGDEGRKSSAYYDPPIDVKLQKPGRIPIPQELAVCAGIAERDRVMFRAGRDFIEIWLPKRLTEYCARLANLDS